jgi:hypothetical protein
VESLAGLIKAVKKVAKRNEIVQLYLCSCRRRDDGLDLVLKQLEAHVPSKRSIEFLRLKDRAELYRIPLFFK